MIHVIVRERDATAQATEPITSGSVGLECSFRFSEDWDGLGKVAIFQGSGQVIDVALVGQESCAVPHEVLQQALGHLKIGVYGTGDQGQRVTPTIWADAGRILPGVEPSEIEPTPATQSLVQQILEAAENAEEIAQSVRDDADEGEFDGPAGPQGEPGVYVGDTEPTDPTVTVWVDTDGDPDPEIAAITATVDSETGIPSVDVTLSGPANSREIAFAFHNLKGNTGATGQQGQQGIQGEAGPAGVGVPTGGTAGQVLAKASGTDYDTEWINQSGGTQEVFWATYNTTTEAEITTAVTAGQAVLCKISDEIFYLTGKAAIGPSGTAWLFASANQTSVRVTFVSGSYWNSISTKTIPSTAADVSAVAANQGTANAGMFMVVGSDGIVAPVTMSAWQGGNY